MIMLERARCSVNLAYSSPCSCCRFASVGDKLGVLPSAKYIVAGDDSWINLRKPCWGATFLLGKSFA
jgi:hypothetical protein